MSAGPSRLFSVKTMPIVHNGLGISIISTPKGVMSDNAARENNVGGEILCRVFWRAAERIRYVSYWQKTG